MQPNTRFHALDALRFAAAIGVVAYHFGGRSDLPGLMPHGYLAVDFFFVLSGFVVTHAYMPKLLGSLTSARFLTQRWIRLWPMLIPGTMLGAAMEIWRPNAGDSTNHAIQVGVTAVLGAFAIPWPFSTAMEQTIFPINGPIWSLFFELFANIVFVFVVKSIASRALMITLAISGFCGLVACALTVGTIDIGPYLGSWPGGFARVTWSFFCGALLSVYPIRIPRLHPWMYPLILIVVMILPVAPGIGNTVVDLGIVLCLFPFLVGSAANYSQSGRVGRLCSIAGELSYPIYAVHYPIIRAICFILNKHPMPDLTRVCACGGSIILICGVSWAVYYGFDRPARRFLSKLLLSERNTPIVSDQDSASASLAGREIGFGS